jgi:hypothetical protein
MTLAYRSKDETLKVLVVGVLLTDIENLALDITSWLSHSKHEVVLAWAAVGSAPIPLELNGHTLITSRERVDKFELVNRLLKFHQLRDFDYLVVIDDDVELSDAWFDEYLHTQVSAGIDLGQPARTPDSFISHPFTIQIPGIDSRVTEFVEIGPVFSLSRSAIEHLVPFTEAWPMGWGLEAEWRAICRANNLIMGIIDAQPVRHALRPTASTYSTEQSDAHVRKLLREQSLDPVPEGFRVSSTTVDTATYHLSSTKIREPQISAIIATQNRADLLKRSLAALTAQTIEHDDYEVVIVDDGSVDDTREVVESFSSLLPIRYVYQRASGIASARNLGVAVSRGIISLFLDDDDVASPQLLHAHLTAHDDWPGLNVAVLGLTELGGSLTKRYLMRHLFSSHPGQLFSYGKWHRGQVLSSHEFWGGRSSAKRAFLLSCGLFDPRFIFGAEDIELAIRLSHHGLEVRFEPEAKSYMIRSMEVEDFVQRCIKQGSGIAKAFSYSLNEGILESVAYLFDDTPPVDVGARNQIQEALCVWLDVADDLTVIGEALPEAFGKELSAALSYLGNVAMRQGFDDACTALGFIRCDQAHCSHDAPTFVHRS